MKTIIIVVSVSLILRTAAVAGAELNPPHNLTMTTMNTNYSLSWTWKSPDHLSVNFTTQYVAKYRLKYKSLKWHTACEGWSRRSCDLTALGLYYPGIYVLRVQASVDGRVSDWATKEFCAEKDAAVGPPSSVRVVPAGSSLDVVISDPKTSNNVSMKEELLQNLYYHVLYWERSAQPQGLKTHTLITPVNLVTLSSLTDWTWYCVSVQTCNDYYYKRSSFTTPQCMQTEGRTPWWQITGYFVCSLLVCFLAMTLTLYVAFWSVKTVKATFWPKVQLPSPFQYLSDSSGSDIPRLLSPESQSELCCDQVTVCPEPQVLEVHDPRPQALCPPPAGLDSDNSGGHSRQDSNSSRDSGMFSSGMFSSGGSTLSEQLKMKDMDGGLKVGLLAVEGVRDLCV